MTQSVIVLQYLQLVLGYRAKRFSFIDIQPKLGAKLTVLARHDFKRLTEVVAIG
jgi:hypothetical protein